MSATTDVLHVELRDKVGTAATVRLRRQGKVPAVLYGHQEANQHLAIPVTDVKLLLRHHGKAVTLDGAIQDTALVSHVQFDPLGINVLHLDLIRVNLQEMVEVSVPIHIVGDAVGVRGGGVLLENLHEVEVRCPAGSIPESLLLDVNDLALGGHKLAGDLKLPEGVELVTSPEAVVAHVERPRGDEEPVDEVVAEGDAVKGVNK